MMFGPPGSMPPFHPHVGGHPSRGLFDFPNNNNRDRSPVNFGNYKNILD